MLDRLRDLWAERPAIVAAAVIAPLAFVITLLILFLVVGSGENGAQQESVAQQQSQAEQPVEQAETPPVQETKVVVQTPPDDRQQEDAAQRDQPSPQPAERQTSAEQTQDSQSGAQQPAASDQEQPQAEQAQSEADSEPLTVAGRVVEPLHSVLIDEFDEADLKHGTDGAEGGILPIDNGVVVSSGPDHETTWELIVPSASLKGAIVRVGHTRTGAMGSPDNPYVIGWLDSSAAPGDTGNTLLAGHRDFEDMDGNVGTGVCWELVNTAEGDQMIVRDNSSDIYYVYTVTEAVTVNPRDRSSARFLQDADEPMITLITCTGSFNAETHQYSHRFVVVGVLTAVASPDA